MVKTITIDPLTRIEGHLKIKVEVEGKTVIRAFSSGEMFRGWEVILKGRDPLDAPVITQRACGVCPQSHGYASVLCLDDALGVDTPDNGRIIRNLMLGANYFQSHILHFYHLAALDFIDVTAVLKYSGNDARLIKIKNWVKNGLDSGDPFAGAPFLPRYKADYIKDTDLNIHALLSYVTALDMRRKAHEMLCIFGGKMPHVQTLFPGGVSVKPTLNDIVQFRYRLNEITRFIDEVYLPDVLAVAHAFPAYLSSGRSTGNYLSYGVFLNSNAVQDTFFPQGVILNNDLETLDTTQIAEHVRYARYSSPSRVHPSHADTIPEPHKKDAYSFIKAPRYKGKAMETGPLSRMLIAYRKGHAAVKAKCDATLKILKKDLNSLESTMGRHVARAIEASVLAAEMQHWLDQLDPGKPVHTRFRIPEKAEGIGLTEAARGALGHWVSINGRLIERYDMVVPTTWNASPRDDYDKTGPIETALTGINIEDAENPIEVGRIVRSFDPCLSCAIHMIDNGKDITPFRVI